MADNTKIRTLEDLVKYGASSDYTIPKVITLRKVGKVIMTDEIVYDKYRDLIFQNSYLQSLTIEQQKSYKYRPDRLSMELYGMPNLAHILLYLNQCAEIDFKPGDTVRVLDPDAVLDVLKLILTHETGRITAAKQKAMG